jgi:hypothetical protein
MIFNFVKFIATKKARQLDYFFDPPLVVVVGYGTAWKKSGYHTR